MNRIQELEERMSGEPLEQPAPPAGADQQAAAGRAPARRPDEPVEDRTERIALAPAVPGLEAPPVLPASPPPRRSRRPCPGPTHATTSRWRTTSPSGAGPRSARRLNRVLAVILVLHPERSRRPRHGCLRQEPAVHLARPGGRRDHAAGVGQRHREHQRRGRPLREDRGDHRLRQRDGRAGRASRASRSRASSRRMRARPARS